MDRYVDSLWPDLTKTMAQMCSRGSHAGETLTDPGSWVHQCALEKVAWRHCMGNAGNVFHGNRGVWDPGIQLGLVHGRHRHRAVEFQRRAPLSEVGTQTLGTRNLACWLCLADVLTNGEICHVHVFLEDALDCLTHCLSQTICPQTCRVQVGHALSVPVG